MDVAWADLRDGIFSEMVALSMNIFPRELFEKYDMHLVFTGVTRNSKKILKELSCNIEKINPLLDNLNSR